MNWKPAGGRIDQQVGICFTAGGGSPVFKDTARIGLPSNRHKSHISKALLAV